MTAGNPVVCYQQHNSKTCLFNATSCVLSYYGDSIGAEKIDNMTENQFAANPIHAINAFMCKAPMSYNIYKIQLSAQQTELTWHIKQEGKQVKKTTYSIAKSHIDFWPKVGIIHPLDGTISHAIGVVDGWIFDSNLSHAMSLTKQNLDLCSSSDTKKCDFVSFSHCFMYVKRSNCSWYRQPTAKSSLLTQQKIQKQEDAKQKYAASIGKHKTH